jgi:hypothetical protein
MKAWLFDPNRKTIIDINYHSNLGDINWELFMPAYADTVHPREYNLVKEILDAPSILNVSPFTVKSTRFFQYKIWVKDDVDKNGPGTRFFNTTAVIYDKVILVKYIKKTLPKLEINEILEHCLDFKYTNKLFFEPSEIIDCEIPSSTNYEWISNGYEPSTSGYKLNDDLTSFEELLYKCEFCKNICGNLKCSKCKKTYYCNTTCQSLDWSKHKKKCQI